MQDNHITGSKLYMLWNDCCGRNTEKALAVMKNFEISRIVRLINYDGGRGIPITAEDLAQHGAV